jgi:pilus assembly protein CpaE
VDVVQSPGSQTFGAALSSERVRHVLTFVRNRYDWIVLDVGRFDALAVELFSDFDSCLVVATEDVPTLRDAKRFIETVCAPAKGKVNLLLNRLSLGQKWIKSEMTKQVEGVACFSFPANDSIREAFSEGKLDASALQPAFRDLAGKLAGMPAEQQPKRRLRLFARTR